MAHKPAAPNLAGALAAMAQASRGRRRPSPLYQWLETNYDGLSAAFQRAPPSWTKLADYLSEHGVTGAEGRRPSPVAVRNAWFRLEAAETKRRGPPAHIGVPDLQLPDERDSGAEYDFTKAPFVR
jgi:hypothetical protein